MEGSKIYETNPEINLHTSNKNTHSMSIAESTRAQNASIFDCTPKTKRLKLKCTKKERKRNNKPPFCKKEKYKTLENRMSKLYLLATHVDNRYPLKQTSLKQLFNCHWYIFQRNLFRHFQL